MEVVVKKVHNHNKDSACSRSTGVFRIEIHETQVIGRGWSVRYCAMMTKSQGREIACDQIQLTTKALQNIRLAFGTNSALASILPPDYLTFQEKRYKEHRSGGTFAQLFIIHEEGEGFKIQYCNENMVWNASYNNGQKVSHLNVGAW